VVEHAFRMGKVAEVYPFPQQHYLNSLSQAWMAATSSLSTAESGLTGNVSSITQQTNSEWHDAMRQFCSSLWGTTYWGGSREGYEWKHDSSSSQTATHPVMAVLFHTAQKVSDLLYEFAEAAVYLNREVWDVYIEAVRDAIPKVEVNLKDGVGMDDVKGLVKGVVKGVAKGASQLGPGHRPEHGHGQAERDRHRVQPTGRRARSETRRAHGRLGRGTPERPEVRSPGGTRGELRHEGAQRFQDRASLDRTGGHQERRLPH
jgi:hypothetical protein